MEQKTINKTRACIKFAYTQHEQSSSIFFLYSSFLSPFPHTNDASSPKNSILCLYASNNKFITLFSIGRQQQENNKHYYHLLF